MLSLGAAVTSKLDLPGDPLLQGSFPLPHSLPGCLVGATVLDLVYLGRLVE